MLRSWSYVACVAAEQRVDSPEITKYVPGETAARDALWKCRICPSTFRLTNLCATKGFPPYMHSIDGNAETAFLCHWRQRATTCRLRAVVYLGFCMENQKQNQQTGMYRSTSVTSIDLCHMANVRQTRSRQYFRRAGIVRQAVTHRSQRRAMLTYLRRG